MRDVLALIGILAVLPLSGASAELFGWDKLIYGVEWRGVRSGTVVVNPSPTEGNVHLESAGILAALFKVEDTYKVRYDGNFCAINSTFDTLEGKRHRETVVNYDRAQRQRPSFSAIWWRTLPCAAARPIFRNARMICFRA